jgi:hypothetical protein
MMNKPLFLSLLLSLAAAPGCGKKPDPVAKEPRSAPAGASVASDDAAPPPPPPPSAPGTPGAPEPDAAPPAAASTETEGRNGFLQRVYSTDPQVAIKAMNQFIEGRNMTATTELKSLEQLVTEAGWPRAPKAPAGSRYVLDPKTKLVVLSQ